MNKDGGRERKREIRTQGIDGEMATRGRTGLTCDSAKKLPGLRNRETLGGGECPGCTRSTMSGCTDRHWEHAHQTIAQEELGDMASVKDILD